MREGCQECAALRATVAELEAKDQKASAHCGMLLCSGCSDLFDTLKEERDTARAEVAALRAELAEVLKLRDRLVPQLTWALSNHEWLPIIQNEWHELIRTLRDLGRRDGN